MAAEHGRAPAGAVSLHAAPDAAGDPDAPAFGTTMAVLGVVTARQHDSLTVHVRRGGPAPAGTDRLVTYRATPASTRVYKGGHRTTLDEIAVGDLVLVHTLTALHGDAGAVHGTAARIHGLTPSLIRLNGRAIGA